MTFPSNADSDPDPTSQIAWPGRQGKPARHGSGSQLDHAAEDHRDGYSSTSRSNGVKHAPAGAAVEAEGSGKRRMSTLDLIYLSISMGGSQVAWTVELG